MAITADLETQLELRLQFEELKRGYRPYRIIDDTLIVYKSDSFYDEIGVVFSIEDNNIKIEGVSLGMNRVVYEDLSSVPHEVLNEYFGGRIQKDIIYLSL